MKGIYRRKQEIKIQKARVNDMAEIQGLGLKKVEMDYFYGCQAEQFTFYRIPKLLFKDERLKSISAEAKILYGLMLDRMGLSMKNGWLDDENRVYIKYPIEEIMEDLGCGRNKAIAIAAELDTVKGIGLIEKRRRGLGEASWIYVKNFMSIIQELPPEPQQTTEQSAGKTEAHSVSVRKPEIEKQIQDNCTSIEECYSDKKRLENSRETAQNQEVYFPNFLKFKNQTSGGLENKLQEVQKTNSNDNNINDTDNNNYISINPSINHTGSIPKSYKTDRMDEMDGADLEKLRHDIKNKIDYTLLRRRYDAEDIDGLVELMVELLSSRKAAWRIGDDSIPAALMQRRISDIRSDHIEYIMDCLKENTARIKNIKQYLITALFNAPVTIGHFYKAEANHDWYGCGS